jgi:two-component system chemotaxis response regulator CheY
MRILIVDDSMAMRKIVQRTLRLAGYEGHEIVEADNGKTALAAMGAATPDLVLCDWNMPEMNGLEFLQAVRAQGSKVPFGFVTTEGTPEMRQVARDAGASFLIAKPFTPDDMARALQAAL